MALFKRRAAIVPEAPELEATEPEAPEPKLEVTEPHPLYGENYEPHFPRLSVTRRVLGHVTHEVDKDSLGPRNTLNALTVGLIADPHTEISYPAQVQPYLDDLVSAGLLIEAYGVYSVTEAGWRELMN